MDTAQYPGKNKLWALWKGADRLTRTEIRLELEKAGIYRYWKDTASKETYDLSNAKGKLIQIFYPNHARNSTFFRFACNQKSHG